MKSTRELLLECRAKNGWTSDYRLAKELGIPRQRISDYMSEERKPDTYALVRIAECLKINPLELVAEFESENAKREEEREYWKGFIGRAKQRVLPLLLVLLCTLFGAIAPPAGGGFFRSRKYV